MRKLLMAASAAAMAISMPVLAQGKGGGKGNGGDGGGPPAHAGKPDKGSGGGGGHGRGGGGEQKFEAARGGSAMFDKRERGGGKPDKAERSWAKQEMKAERRFEREAKSERKWSKSEAKAEKSWRKDEAKADKQFAKQERKAEQAFRRDRELRLDDRAFRDDRDARNYRDGARFASVAGNCPPGLAKKGNGCMPPGLAKQSFTIGDRLPAQYYGSYNVPARYQDWYQDGGDYSYRYDDGNIYRLDSGSNIISGLIPLLGGGFGVGSLLPAGYDAYNLPTQYRDDYADTDEAYYRYGDNAIYQVDPKSQVIEAVVALLAGNLNVGQMLPAGYDAYNLPMDYRDQYVDSDDAMYRYADGNIYQIDPKTQIIEQIVAMLT